MASRSSTTDPPRNDGPGAAAAALPDAGRQLPPTVAVGRVGRPHGIRGEVVVFPLSEVEERFAAGSRLLAVLPSGERRQLEVAASRPHKGALLVQLAGVDERDGAEALRGASLEVERSRVPPAPADSFYFFELEGCRCHDRAAGDLGEVMRVVEDGGGVMLIVDSGGRRLPIPFVKAFLRRVDVVAGVIELELPEGLIEACASRS